MHLHQMVGECTWLAPAHFSGDVMWRADGGSHEKGGGPPHAGPCRSISDDRMREWKAEGRLVYSAGHAIPRDTCVSQCLMVQRRMSERSGPTGCRGGSGLEITQRRKVTRGLLCAQGSRRYWMLGYESVVSNNLVHGNSLQAPGRNDWWCFASWTFGLNKIPTESADRQNTAERHHWLELVYYIPSTHFF